MAEEKVSEMIIGSEIIIVVQNENSSKKTDFHKLMTDWQLLTKYLVQTVEEGKDYKVMNTQGRDKYTSVIIGAGNRITFRLEHTETDHIKDDAAAFVSYLIDISKPFSVLYQPISVNENEFEYTWKNDNFHRQFTLWKGPFQKLAMGHFMNYFTVYDGSYGLRLDDTGFSCSEKETTIDDILYHKKIVSEGLERFDIGDPEYATEEYKKLLRKQIHNFNDTPAEYMMELIDGIASL